MDLRNFIAQTLTQIIDGITDTQESMIEYQKDTESEYTVPCVNPNRSSENHISIRLLAKLALLKKLKAFLCRFKRGF